MIPELLGNIVRREGRKFRKLVLPPQLEWLKPDQTDMNPDEISLYVHIPFCRSLCPFCCFNRYLFDESTARRYFQDIRIELENYRQRGFRFSAVYFGGGTPTILMDELCSLIEYLRSVFPIKEISLETTPRELTDENIELLRQAGINRLSIGIQSFVEDVLKTMGRINGPAEEVKRRLMAAEGKFDTLNVDFVFNFPGQSIDEFRRDVAAFKAMQLDQATFYPLMASPHKKDAMERKFNRVDYSRERHFYDIIQNELYRGGYTASTVWCFSRGSRMIDEYIIDYSGYIGVGSGSVSIAGGKFFVNTFSLDKYHAFASEERLPIIGWRELADKEQLRYYMLTQLFGMKLSVDKLVGKFGADKAKKLGLEIAFLGTCGYVKGDESIEVTPKGMYPASVMMREFFAALNTLREYCIENQI